MGFQMSKQVLMTMDIDWTSETVIKSALDFIKSLDIPCILFQTHFSESIYNEQSKLFTRELHPNFCDGSDHGSSIKEIISQLSKLDHRGIAVRAHKYYMPDEALQVYKELDYRFSMNNYIDMQYKEPYKTMGNILELNTFFEDGFYLKKQLPLQIEYVIKKMTSDGIYVFNIHPIHLAFNAKEYTLTRNFKDGMSKTLYRKIEDDFIKKHRYTGYGIKSFLTDLINQMKKQNIQFISIEEVTL